MKNIINFKCYKCGSEIFRLSDLYSNCGIKSCELPVNVFLIEHRKFGNMLFNSGCTGIIKKNRIKYISYKRKHKVKFSDSENIISGLAADGLDPLCIRKVILTHADPQCCGALTLIPKYELISSAQVLTTLDFGLFSEGVFKSTIPSKSVERRAVVPFKGDSFLKKYFKWVYDVLGDGSVMGFDLSGHSKAMMGYFIPEKNIFFGADAAITEKAITEDYKPTKKLLNNQFYPDDYLNVFNTLKKINAEHPEIKMIFLHSMVDEL